MKSQEDGCAAEVTYIIEVGRDAGDEKHRGSVSRQAFLAGAREGERRKSMCDGIQAQVLPR